MHSILKKIGQKSRLNEYERILSYAKNNGYRLTSLSDWYKNNFYVDERVILLRHDVDYDSEGALRMFEIEKKLGCKSTFYFRWSTIDSDIMKKMKNHGFEVSLHFETLATYCRKRRIKSADKLTKNDFEECYELLKGEVNEFEKTFWNIETICSHGDHRNRLIGIPNHKILKENYREYLGVFFETYDQEIYNKIETYISDSSIKNNHEWRYGISPEQAIDSKSKCICLLTHPQHWNYHFARNIRKVFIDIKEKILN